MTARRAGTGTATAALRRALAAEQAATYGYGVLGAHLSGPQQAAATATWTAHQEAAGQLAALLTARGVAAGPAGVAYQLPEPVGTAAQARAVAALIEDRVCAAYIGMVGLAGVALREFGARQLRASALRAAAWRGATVAFPGLAGPGLASMGTPREPSAASRGQLSRGQLSRGQQGPG